jgi:hypothetical protein
MRYNVSFDRDDEDDERRIADNPVESKHAC